MIPEEPTKTEDKKPKAPKSAVKRSVRAEKDTTDEVKELDLINRSVIESALRIADRITAHSILLIVDDPANYKVPEAITKRKELILVVQGTRAVDDLRKAFKKILDFPSIKLSRIGKFKLAVMRGLSKGMINPGHKIVCITGPDESNVLDTILVLHIGRESEVLSSAEAGSLSLTVRPEIFEELLTIAVELANQGREGKPIGSLFVLGDTEKVMQLSRQMIFNPFQGYPEEERNILDPGLRDTIKEFSTLDGAFIIRDDGVIQAAGRYLNASLENESLPQGLGSRHAAAAGITAVTSSTAFVISESTGDVRIFRNGKIFMDIEKSTPTKR
jgi:diadenylate cyclase